VYGRHLKKKQEAIEKAEALHGDTTAAGKKADDDAEEEDGDEELEESQLQAEFDRMDTDKDGRVAEEEYVVWAELANPGDSSARHNFRLIDRNKSKKLTFRELFPTSVRKRDIGTALPGAAAAAATPDIPPATPEPTPAPPVPEKKEEKSEEHHDEDHNADEHEEHHDAEDEHDGDEDHEIDTKATDPKFDAADKDADGKLSAAEADAIGLRDEEGSVAADVDKNGFVDRTEFNTATKDKK